MSDDATRIFKKVAEAVTKLQKANSDRRTVVLRKSGQYHFTVRRQADRQIESTREKEAA
jgi:hypothetical protein